MGSERQSFLKRSTALFVEQDNYEETRKKLRYGKFQSGLLLFLSTIGPGIFTYQYAYGKVRMIKAD